MNVVQVKSAKDVIWDALCKYADEKGRVSLSVIDLSKVLVNVPGQPTTGAIGKHATTHLLYSMQKGGLITFHEVGAGSSRKDIVDIALTPKGLSRKREWTTAVRDVSHQYRGHKNRKRGRR